MKTIMKSFLLLAVVTLAACNVKPQTHAHHGDQDESKKETFNERTLAKKTVVSLKDDPLNAVYQQYAQLTNSLINGDVAQAKVAASAIEKGAQQFEGGKPLLLAANQIIMAKAIEEQRSAYADLSNDFNALLKKTGMLSGELHVAHCPMALNNKGASWISDTQEIRNPYFGESMLNCGSIKETFN